MILQMHRIISSHNWSSLELAHSRVSFVDWQWCTLTLIYKMQVLQEGNDSQQQFHTCPIRCCPCTQPEVGWQWSYNFFSFIELVCLRHVSWSSNKVLYLIPQKPRVFWKTSMNHPKQVWKTQETIKVKIHVQLLSMENLVISATVNVWSSDKQYQSWLLIENKYWHHVSSPATEIHVD